MAGTLSGSLGVPVDVVHVVSDGAVARSASVQEYARIEKVVITQRELLESIGTRVVEDSANRVHDKGCHVGGVDVLVGSPAQEIVEYARDHDADVIVMGRRGLGDLAGLFMGSVSHKVGHLTDLTLVTTE